MASRLADLSQGSQASQISPPAQKMNNVSRSQQSFLQAWKPNKSDSRYLRGTTNYDSDPTNI